MEDFKFFSDLSKKVDYLIELLETKTSKTPSGRKPMDVTEAADYLKLSKQAIYNRVHQQTIPFHKNGKLFFLQDELDSFITGAWKPTYKK